MQVSQPSMAGCLHQNVISRSNLSKYAQLIELAAQLHGMRHLFPCALTSADMLFLLPV